MFSNCDQSDFHVTVRVNLKSLRAFQDRSLTAPSPPRARRIVEAALVVVVVVFLCHRQLGAEDLFVRFHWKVPGC